jgi:hypothetical protein
MILGPHPEMQETLIGYFLFFRPVFSKYRMKRFLVMVDFVMMCEIPTEKFNIPENQSLDFVPL